MNPHVVHRTSVSALIGAPISRPGGAPFGRVREFAVSPAADVHHVHALVVRTAAAAQPVLVPISALSLDPECRLALAGNPLPGDLPVNHAVLFAILPPDDQTYLLLERDVLDQQIIDVNGHKVVRVNDVDLVWEPPSGTQTALALRIAEVEVGLRGAVRRLLKGLPAAVVARTAARFGPAVIPWEFVDLIDRDPTRRVKLKIEQDRLSRMHPSDIAGILEELAPTERQALFNSLDEEVAAEALEEVDPRLQQALIASLDSEQIANIVEEMDPAAAADLLSELSDEQSDAILEEMDPDERHDVQELLEFPSNSAAGRMTTQYVALRHDAAVVDAIVALRAFEGDLETVADIFLLDQQGRLAGIVPLVKLLLSPGGDPLAQLSNNHLVCCDRDDSGKKVASLFDKYNLRSLAVVDDDKRLAGVIHAEQVIALLRSGR